MLPNFLIIGTQKAATSWLARCLDRHPDVFTLGWESQFFNNNFSKGLEWYESQFRDWSGQPIVGEKTPGYLSDPQAPARIHETLGPDTKLICCLRHPVDRAYSAFWQFTKKKRIPANLDFRTLLLNNEYPDLRERGFYFSQLSRYLDIFPRQNLLVLIYEELNADRHAAMAKCLEFLGVDNAGSEASSLTAESLNQRVNRGRGLRQFHSQAVSLRRSVASKVSLLPRTIREPIMNAGRFAFEHMILRRLPRQKDYVLLDKDVRQELMALFASDIKQLEDLLGRDLSIWTELASTPQPKFHSSVGATVS